MKPVWKKGACALVALTLALPALPCTTLVVDGERGPLFARNYDFEFGEALVLVNPRGLERTSAARAAPGATPARWTARHGSVTFNQFGVGFPTGGINEAGLVVELMWLDGTRYPTPDSRPAVTTLEFIQYLLDGSATLAEALQAAAEVRIAGSVPLHFLVSDRQGRTATVEFLDGKLVVHQGADLPVRALANDRYDRSLAALQSNAGAEPSGVSSLARFVRAASRAGGRHTVAQAFAVLDNVAQPGATHWQIVYDMVPGTIRWRTSANAQLRTLSLDQVSFDCRQGIRLVDVHAGSGDMRGAFKPYTRAADEAQLRVAYGKASFFRGDATKEAADDAAATEGRLRCAASA